MSEHVCTINNSCKAIFKTRMLKLREEDENVIFCKVQEVLGNGSNKSELYS